MKNGGFTEMLRWRDEWLLNEGGGDICTTDAGQITTISFSTTISDVGLRKESDGVFGQRN
jgi:hypothetical protein